MLHRSASAAGIAISRSARSELMLYGGSHVGKSILWQSADALSLYFWTEVAGVEPLAAGWLFLIGMIWSGLLDLLVGSFLAQRTDYRCRRMLQFGIPASAITFAAMFAAPVLWPQGGITAAAVTSVLFRTAYAAIDVPQNFLMIKIADSTSQLSRLSGARTITGSATSIGVAAAVGWLVVPHQPLATATQHFYLAGVLAAVASAPLLLPCLYLKHHAPQAHPEQTKTPFAADATVFLHLILAVLVMGAIGKVLPYAALESGRTENWAGQAFLLLTIGKVMGGFVWPGIADRRSVWSAAALAHLVTLPLLLAAGWTDLSAGLLAWVLLLSLGFTLGGMNTLAWAMLGDSNGAASGNAMVVSLFTVAAKLAVGLSGLLVAWIASTPRSPLLLTCLITSVAALAAAVLMFKMKGPLFR